MVFVLLTIGTGVWAGFRLRGTPTESMGSVVGATLGLLAFLLAFTFNMTATRFDERKKLLLEEVNAIGTCYLRAGLLGEPFVTEVRGLVRTYVKLRVDSARDPALLPQVIAESETIHDRLWAMVESMLADRPATIRDSLFVQSLNDVIDLHQDRIAVGLQFRIPTTIWVGLYAVAGLSMLVVGFQFGQARQRPLAMIVLLALAFSAVCTLIVDLDRASEGTVSVDQQALFDLQKKVSSVP